MDNNESKLAGFLQQAGVGPEAAFDVRRIGTSDEMVELIIRVIESGEKTMTYSLPWLRQATGRPQPVPGLYVVALGADHEPALLLRLIRVRELAFGAVSEADLTEEGIPMRDLAAWRPLHIDVWNEKLGSHGLAVSDDMPVTAEYFEVVHARAR